MKNSIKDKKKRESIEITLPLIFDAIDTNNDGKLLYEEFSNYFSSLGNNNIINRQMGNNGTFFAFFKI